MTHLRTLSDDEWREIDEFPGYLINENGKVYSEKRNKILSDRHDKHFHYVGLCKDGKLYRKGINELLSKAFPPDHGDDWCEIEGYPEYEVGKIGEIYSKRSRKKLEHLISKDGYHSVQLCKNGHRLTKRINRLVAEAFIPNPKNKPEVNHIDLDKSNNRVDNLEWSTHSENMAHAKSNKAIKNVKTRKVRVIETGEVFDSLIDCARHLNIRKESISQCLNGRQKSCYGYHFEDVKEVNNNDS